MTRHFQIDMDLLNQRLLRVSSGVAEALQKSVKALLDRDKPLAEQVINGDVRINRREVEIEEECLKLLALYQPVAEDLRFIAAVLKTNTDLERMGDEAVNIAEHAVALTKADPVKMPEQLGEMSAAAMKMVFESLDAFVKRDTALARKVCEEDDVVDDLNGEVIKHVKTMMQESPQTISPAMRLFSVSRHLERIADHATNIGEHVVYMVEGTIIRHNEISFTRADVQEED